jgi:hypothetical protein
MTPFVECWIGGTDIMRDREGKPKTLLSFSLTQLLGSGATFVLEVFDDTWTAIEDLILQRATKEKGGVTTPALVRFGYLGADGVYMCAPGGIEGACYNCAITSYTPILDNFGMRLIINGSAQITNVVTEHSPKPKRLWNKPVKDIVAQLVEENGWEWDGNWVLEGEGGEPEELPLVGEHHLTTEAQAARFIQGANETDIAFLKRIIKEVRPQDQALNTYHVRLESIAIPPDPGSVGGADYEVDTITLLQIFALDIRPNAHRTYTVLRDPDSEVIRWSPQLSPFIFASLGGAGLVMRLVDSRLRKAEHLPYSEEMSYFKYLKRLVAPPAAAGGDVEVGVDVEGSEGNEDTRTPTEEDILEGTRSGREQMRAYNQMTVDEPYHVLPLYERDRIRGDRQALLQWMDTFQRFNAGGELEIIGDPWIVVGKIADVFVFVTGPDGEPALHYSTNRYTIQTVVHNISGGSYTSIIGLGAYGSKENTTGEITQAPVVAQEAP